MGYIAFGIHTVGDQRGYIRVDFEELADPAHDADDRFFCAVFNRDLLSANLE